MDGPAFRWPRLVPSDALAFACIIAAVVCGVDVPLPVAMLPVFALLLVAFGLLALAKR